MVTCYVTMAYINNFHSSSQAENKNTFFDGLASIHHKTVLPSSGETHQQNANHYENCICQSIMQPLNLSEYD